MLVCLMTIIVIVFGTLVFIKWLRDNLDGLGILFAIIGCYMLFDLISHLSM